MKKIRYASYVLLAFLLSTNAMALSPQSKHQAQLRLIDSFLANHHYKSALLDDEKSKEVLMQYIDYLDFGKYLFTRNDLKQFHRYDKILDDLTHRGELRPVFEMYNVFLVKRKAQIEWILKRLDEPFDENASGELQLDREKVDWAKDQDELEARWEKMILNSWITLRLTKQSDAKARATLKKRYQNMKKTMRKTKPDEVFQLFANALTSVYDPHTSYFSPRTGEDFDINMRLSLEGIGAQLTIEEELITIKELIAGGPAKKSGKLSPNDHILGVAQGRTGAMEDVVGWRLGDAVELIRGKRGTTVRLQIQKALNDEIVEISLVRDKIKLEESAAKSSIKPIQIGDKTYRIGVIELPSFYVDFAAQRRGDKNYRSTTRDVKNLVIKLQKDGIDGLMIDLRNNGGGSLSEVVDLTGLFLDSGSVVQVRGSDGTLDIRKDEDGKTLYSGPLAVLINEHSASASEIFAGAIKDYRRGVILGQPTFGKGTVQTVIGLKRFLPSIKEKVGQLKMTIAMFYRINGSSTQQKGVAPDIYIPNKASHIEGGESEEDNALPWHKIASLPHKDFTQLTSVLLTKLKKTYNADNKDNPLMKNLLALYAWQKEEKDNSVVSLSLDKRRARKIAIRDKNLALQNNFRKEYGYPLLTADYLDKESKDKTEAEKDNDEKYEVDAVEDIAVKTVANYVDLLN